MEDMEIVELFWSRDEKALKEVDKKYNYFCFNTAWKILENREDSEECVNDTWFRAWKSIPPVKPSILSAFLGRITRNFAIDNLRKKYAAKRTDLHMENKNTEIMWEVESLNGWVANSLEKHIEEKELIQLINSFLGKLSEKDRDIFIHRYWHMDSVADIAARHKVSKNSIKSNLFRTRNKLKKLLEREGYFI